MSVEPWFPAPSFAMALYATTSPGWSFISSRNSVCAARGSFDDLPPLSASTRRFSSPPFTR